MAVPDGLEDEEWRPQAVRALGRCHQQDRGFQRGRPKRWPEGRIEVM
jgi:hypothetical protein